MAKRKRDRTTRHYNPFQFPPGWFWSPSAPCSRAEAPAFLAAMETATSERRGAHYYFADPKAKRTVCRFEWGFRFRPVADLLRVGCEVVIEPDSVRELKCFASTNAAVGAPWKGLPSLPDEAIVAAQRDVAAVLARASALCDPVNHRDFHVVTHIKTGGGASFGAAVTLDQSASTILPTVVLLGSNAYKGRVSGVVTTVRAAGREEARHVAKRATALLSALATLATSLPFVPVNLEWSRRLPRREFLPDASAVRGVYPRHVPLPSDSGETPADLPVVLRALWDACATLEPAKRGTFDQALLAHFGAMEIRYQQPTIAVVAVVAALNLLAAPLGEECRETLRCPTHGPLSFKHRTRGDAAAITALTCDLLGFAEGSDEARGAKKLIGAVYSKQRSSYVHGAELRHGEYGGAEHGPSILPTTTSQFSELLEYEGDAESILVLCRRVLVAWLARESGTAIEVGTFDRGSGVRRIRTAEIGMTTLAGVWSQTRIMPWTPEEEEAARAAAAEVSPPIVTE